MDKKKAAGGYPLRRCCVCLNCTDDAMVEQLDLFTGAELRDKGIQRAVDHANEVHEGWSDQAFKFLKAFLLTHRGEFMTEYVRAAASGIVPEPPSKRAWGGVMTRAKNEGLIRSIGFRSVTNAKAHCTPASVWLKV